MFSLDSLLYKNVGIARRKGRISATLDRFWIPLACFGVTLFPRPRSVVDASVAVAADVDTLLGHSQLSSNSLGKMSSKSAVAAAKSQVAERRLRPIYGKLSSLS